MAIQISDRNIVREAECCWCRTPNTGAQRQVEFWKQVLQGGIHSIVACDTCLRELHDEVCRLIDEHKI